jgi:hypothetical protein
MAENNGTNGGSNNPQPGESSTQPQVNVLGQYIKDLSFESPDTDRFFRGPGKNPNLQLNFNVQVRTRSPYPLKAKPGAMKACFITSNLFMRAPSL